MRILVVDDEEPVLDLVALLCTQEGHDVAKARSSTDALRQLHTSIFDLIVTDIVMPGINGLMLVRKARALHRDLMAIVITGHAGEHTPADVLAAGATDLILKPFRPTEFRARLRLAVEQKQMMERWRAERRDVQRAGAQMIASLQRELEEARQQVARLSAGLPPSTP
jgi:DNA-binding response OmpR family regulator